MTGKFASMLLQRWYRPSPVRHSLRHWLAGLLLALGAMLMVVPAAARGSVRVRNAAPKENDGEWKLKFTIDYGSIPHLAHMPMVFSFKPVVLYERSLTDKSGDTPVQRSVRLHNQTPISVSMDVGFADAGGTVYKITKFSVKLRRENEFEAGEYELTVKLASGATLGRKIRIKLLGDNKVVDRRAMVFGGSVGGGKKKATPAPEPAADSDTGPVAAEDMGPDLSGIGDDDDDDDQAPIETPPEVKAKQGGCGCRLGAPQAHHHGWPALALLALVLGGSMRRRQDKPARAT